MKRLMDDSPGPSLLRPETVSARRPKARGGRGGDTNPLGNIADMLLRSGGIKAGDGDGDGDGEELLPSLAGLSQMLDKLLKVNGRGGPGGGGGPIGLTKVKQHWAPLHVAAQDGKVAIARAMLERGAIVDPREDDDWTPLMLAAQNGHNDVVALLLEQGADINAQANDGRTALFQAVQRGNEETVRLLLLHKPEVNLALKEGSTPLWMAVHKVCKDDADNDDKVGDGDGDGNNKTTRRRVHMGMIPLLLQAGADADRVDGLGVSPLTLAVLRENFAVAEILLQHGADVNCVDGLQFATPLIHAAVSQKLDLVRLCLAHGANIHAAERQGWTALHVAVRKMRPDAAEIVRLLIEAGADVHARTHEGALAMQIAAQEGYTELVRLMVELGRADVNALGRDARTAAFSAVMNGQAETFHYLADRGAKLDIISEMGLNLIHMAALQSDTELLREVVSMCVRSGVDIDARTTNGNLTALHIASMSDEESIALALLDLGASP